MTINTIISHFILFENLGLLLDVVKVIIEREHFIEYDEGLSYHGKCRFNFCPGCIKIKSEPMNNDKYPSIYDRPSQL